MNLHLKNVICVLFFFSFMLNINAQEKKIIGVVSDSAGPLPGVSIVIKGTVKGTETDFDGNYTMNVKTGDVLVYMFLGYAKVEKVVGESSTINVAMKEDANILDEVVVSVAYAAKKKKDIIGAVSVVSAKEVGDLKVTTVTEALQGTSGLSMVNASGQPGASPTIRIRGVGSLQGNVDPLIIVDGAQFAGNLNSINFNDVESYSVLKDADAVSLYGNRGANGVIIIKTKSGVNTNGEGIIEINTSYGFSDKATDDYSYLSAEQIVTTSWQAIRNERLDQGDAAEQAAIFASSNVMTDLAVNPYSINEPVDTNGKIKSNARLLYETNYYDILTQKATRQDVSLVLRGGNEKTRYFVSGAFLDSEGFSLNSKFRRYNGRVNLSSDVKSWLSVGANAFVTISESNVPTQSGSTYANNIQYVRSVSSIYPLYKRNADGSFISDNNGNKQYDFAEQRGFFGNYNPLAETYGSVKLYERNTFNFSPYLTVKFNDKINLKSQFNYTNYLYEGNLFNNHFVGTPKEQVDNRYSTKERNTTKTWNVINTLSYKNTFDEKHTLTGLLGQEMYDNTYNRVSATSTGYAFANLPELDNGVLPTGASSITEKNRLYSFFGRLDYNFDEKYYFGTGVRRDASSIFAKENRWGTFWSVAAGWSIYDEFLKGNGLVNSLKLRASYGTVGNQNINQQFTFLDQNGLGFNILANPGLVPTAIANPDLKWETHNKLNIGVDFAFFNSKVYGSLEYYDNRVTDLLYFDVPAPSTGSEGAGIDGNNESRALGKWRNFGEMSNKGFEFNVNSVNVENDKFRWTSSFAISTNQNRIEDIKQIENRGSFRWEAGRDRYEFYMREWAGVNPTTGAPEWYKDVVDTSGKVTGREKTSTYSEATRYYTGKSALPDFEGRLGTKFEYNGIDLTLNFNYKFGNYIYNTDFSSLMKARNLGEQSSSETLKAWQKEGDITDVPKLTTEADDFNSRSTRWLQRGDFIRLKNISLGYNLNQEMLDKLKIRKLRVYLSADNYWTWKRENNLDDPEQAFNGITDNRSTVLKTLSLGVNISL
ncbi:TonB-linked SusC/RagA family outer membrane protein [Tenacibaculum lutimaris]|uniref:TonB-linked SusC/RagA family outer membrane protein n=1 Tax=Tenacibaculum lutimaris TaxID=285258 RepID=A0A420E379_9FLAO|nr:SusC/RagA family TonB-linked outer membrane protein [Tenacibaculum lutimaris]RKF04500.1 TonB-linked SusC/RagA family outer membrane protein [Tenacibaculum lutimaris]